MNLSRYIYIAVVDDDESLCRSFGRLLRAAGVQPITYHSAEAFLGDKNHPKFDCLVFDVQLGGISGIDLYRKLLAGGEPAPVIFITAQDAPETRQAALAFGCQGYFQKPDFGTEVLDLIKRLVA